MRQALLLLAFFYTLGATISGAFWLFRDEYRKWKYGSERIGLREAWAEIVAFYSFMLGWPYYLLKRIASFRRITVPKKEKHQ